MQSNLEQKLKKLRLSGMISTLDMRLQEAVGNHLSHQEFFELMVSDELIIRSDRALKRRIMKADFRDLRTLEDFDFSFNPSISRKDMYDYASGHFIRSHEDILFIGPPGVGKSHLAQSIGYSAVKMGFDVYYRSIFDLVRDFFIEDQKEQVNKTLNRYRPRPPPG